MNEDSPISKLRPVAEHDLDMFEQLDTDPSLSEPYGWHGFRDPQRARRRWEKDGYLGADDSILVVALPDNTFAGFVVWWPISSSAPLEGVEMGIVLLPDYRGRGIGTAAHQLLADYLFSTTPVNRVEAMTEVDNIAEQRALERAGFVREGVLRGRHFDRGQWRDSVVYAMLREDMAQRLSSEQDRASSEQDTASSE